ncbi:2-keto-4-pentenoate hydratase/2-oxohepta-3-ene-1,7-dioic acid hydratase in catechol pathway [Actinocorallia herbida]|uniref:2-keto-4-pentenoate hydratase/2-oxohepta-3-ene-1,7-dioic acid hydratase in catechol pathway n=1 Tax=Actinocorallia herbida TaxID=58109 RepID=A0A3N1CWG9_9ACTN|nr:fumarylacetoacetate hydrolase family protein [Actinocorallia herbida]ROO85614.1 2-keto-4-pentenoate hydratase/2-oxohepta-3-ene-1,7-dioic acid hydratase in catechol pathway [Actinocorallia herbida]
MRIANHAGRAVLVLSDDKAADIATASRGLFSPRIQGVYDRWAEFTAWAATADPVADVDLDKARLGSPSPTPSQVVAIGLNYADHAAETGFEPPKDLPPVFTKFASSITGPYGDIALPEGGHTDWEVEVVAVIGKKAHKVPESDAWSYVAGLTVGQDLSERILQFVGQAPQFGFAKSYPGFAPIGPWLTTLDDVPDKDDLALGCSIDGETVQDGRTSKLIFSIPKTIAELTEVITLHPGDVIFTGTPDGVGLGMTPQRFLQPGETLRTWVEGLGEMTHTFH